MRRYDTTFILNPQIGDDRIDASVKTITTIISNGNGEVLRENRMGSRRLAYDIERQSHGYYVCLIHESAPAVIKELDSHFTLSDDCLRHLTIIFDGEPDRKNMSEIMMGFEADKREEGSGRDSRPPKTEAAPKAEAAPKTEAAEKPVPVQTEAAKPAEKSDAGEGETL